MPHRTRPSLLPSTVRRYVIALVIGLAVLAAILIAWRGPAILLDLAAIAAWCF